MNENVQSPLTPNRVEDRAPKPLGVIPKHLQSLVIMGVAVAMILVMWLTGNSKKATLPRPMSPPPPVSPTDSAKVQDLKQTIQSEQQAARRAIAVPELAPAGAYDVPGIPGSYMNPPQQLGQQPTAPGTALSAGVPPVSGYPPAESTPAASASSQDSVKADKKKRQYLSLFASNVALTYRQGEEAQKLAGTGPEANSADSLRAAPSAQDPQADYLRQLQALEGAPQSPLLPSPTSTAITDQKKGEPPERNKVAASTEPQSAAAKPVDPNGTEVRAFNKTSGKNYVLFEGTVIETVLINRLDGSFAGPVNCLVTHDVYSHHRQRILIPAGSKVLGGADKVNTFGQQRLAVAFHRLIMPDGYSVSLDQFKGLDQIGATALRDKVNNHYLKIFGASLAIGILGGIAQAGTGDVLTASAWDRAQAGFGASSALAGMQILDRFLNILPTITIREGIRVKVYLSNDLLLPDYAQHHMDDDL